VSVSDALLGVDESGCPASTAWSLPGPSSRVDQAARDVSDSAEASTLLNALRS